MRKGKLLFTILVLTFGTIAVNKLKLVETNINIVSAEETNFSIEKGVLKSYYGTEKQVIIPDGVKEIAGGAFSNNNLTSVTIPDSVTKIEPNFYYCYDLEEIIVNPDNKNYEARDGILFEKTKQGLQIVKYPAGKKDTEYKLPEETIAIKESAFSDCSNLLSIEIPNTVIEIGMSAFNSSNLTEIIIPDSVNKIGDMAFYGCKKLNKITIPKNITEISLGWFEYCGFEEFIIPDHITKIEDSAFKSCHELKEIIIPDTVTEIGESAFSNCISLNNVVIGDNVTKIGMSAFHDCENLTNISLPKNITAIEDRTFLDSGLKKITIPDKVEKIGEGAFFGCKNLEEIIFSDLIKEIGVQAFGKCSNLTKIVIPDNVTTIGDSAFTECSNLFSVTIPDSLTELGDSVFHKCSALEEIIVGHGNEKYYSQDGVLFKKEASGLELTLYPAKKKGKKYNIPEEVNTIASSAFSNQKKLTKIILSDNVTKIGREAFLNCKKLTKLTLSNNLTKIEYNAFSGCKELTDITIPRNMKEISYAFGSFYGGTELKNLNITMKKGEKISFAVTLGEGNHTYKPKITYKNEKRVTRQGNILEKEVITAKKKGKVKIIFECYGNKNEKRKTTVNITIK